MDSMALTKPRAKGKVVAMTTRSVVVYRGASTSPILAHQTMVSCG